MVRRAREMPVDSAPLWEASATRSTPANGVKIVGGAGCALAPSVPLGGCGRARLHSVTSAVPGPGGDALMGYKLRSSVIALREMGPRYLEVDDDRSL